MNKQHRRFLLLMMGVFMNMTFLHVQPGLSAGEKPHVHTFSDVYEPSAVVQLTDGSIFIAEDEGDRPFFLSPLVNQKSVLKLEPVRLPEIDIAFDDIEAGALGKDGAVYLTTSSSQNKQGKRKQKRTVLLRFTLKDGRVSDARTLNGLFMAMKKVLERDSSRGVVDIEQLDIEGLCFDSSKEKLLFGLRSPLAERKAIILVLKNPYAIFSKGQEPLFQQEEIHLNLGGGGVRSMTYDFDRKTYLLINEIPNKKGKLKSVLWAWNGDSGSSPVKVPLPGLKGIKNIEGITPVRYRQQTFFLMVGDDGNRKKKKGAHYCFLNGSALAY